MEIPLSGLDPSMLLGFLCKDRENFMRTVVEPIFTIQDEPLTWPSDPGEFMGLESISEPDDVDMDDNDNDKEEGADEPFFDTRGRYAVVVRFGNLSKYFRSKPSSGALHHVAYILSLPDSIHDVIPANRQKPS